MTATKSNRILELDALRALAAINLLLFHFTLVFENKYGYSSPLGFDFPYGKYGVQLFFMLSGFVNTMTLLKKRRPGDFIVSRMIRILPSYWIVIFLNVVLLSTFGFYQVDPNLSGFAANMTVMPQLFGNECWEPVTWTLQVEIIFYFILLTLYLLNAFENTLKTVTLMSWVSLIGCTLHAQAQIVAPNTFTAETTEFFTNLFILKYLPLFGIGMLLHEIRFSRGPRIRNAVGIVVCIVAFHLTDEHGHNPAATAILLGLLTLSVFGKVPLLRCKPLMIVSSSSYALYLFHNNLGCLLIKKVNGFGISPICCLALGIFASFCFAFAYTRWFEQPLTSRLRILWAQFKPELNRWPHLFWRSTTLVDPNVVVTTHDH
ncbi:MAG: acyltransferase [Planctomycetota bacterium]